jgi:hypothetical protein
VCSLCVLHVVLSQLLTSICLFGSHFSLHLLNIQYGLLAVAEPRSIIRKEKIIGEANNFLIGTNPQRQSDMKLREAHKGVKIGDWGAINRGDEEVREMKREGVGKEYEKGEN